MHVLINFILFTSLSILDCKNSVTEIVILFKLLYSSNINCLLLLIEVSLYSHSALFYNKLCAFINCKLGFVYIGYIFLILTKLAWNIDPTSVVFMFCQYLFSIDKEVFALLLAIFLK